MPTKQVGNHRSMVEAPVFPLSQAYVSSGVAKGKLLPVVARSRGAMHWHDRICTRDAHGEARQCGEVRRRDDEVECGSHGPDGKEERARGPTQLGKVQPLGRRAWLPHRHAMVDRHGAGA